MVFKAERGETGPPPTVMKFIAPQELLGPKREENIVKSVIVAPKVNFAGIGGEVGSVTATKEYKFTQRWSFHGARHVETGTNLYQTVRWSWASAPTESHGPPSHLYLAVTVEHASAPFSVEVGVDGKLSGHQSRALIGKFRSRQNKEMARIIPQADQSVLQKEAENLEIEIRQKNGFPPVEAPPVADITEPENPVALPPSRERTIVSPDSHTVPNNRYTVHNIMLPLQEFVIWLLHLVWQQILGVLNRDGRIVSGNESS